MKRKGNILKKVDDIEFKIHRGLLTYNFFNRVLGALLLLAYMFYHYDNIFMMWIIIAGSVILWIVLYEMIKGIIDDVSGL